MCAAIVVILWMAPAPAAVAVCIELGVIAGLSSVLAAVILSEMVFPRSHRLMILLVCSATAVASCYFAPVTIVSWPLPLWCVYRFYRAASC